MNTPDVNLHFPLINTVHVISHSTPILIDQWKEWAQQDQQGVGEQRDVAFLRLLEYLEHDRNILNLAGLNLTQLPFLPDNIIKLDVSGNQLTHLPETLSDGLEHLIVNSNHLSHLPDTLPPSLRKLDASNNQLTHLPNRLPVDLLLLLVNHNLLTYLPNTLPPALVNLDVSHNQLTFLPNTFPTDLTGLDVSHNLLSHLPNTLPPELIALDASHNLLTGLPNTLQHGMLIFDVGHNPLVLPSGTNLLPSERIIRRTQPIHEQTKPSLIETLRLWDPTSDINLWEKIGQEENADHFSLFLKSLHQQGNAGNASLRTIVSTWLADLAKEENKEIRAQTFAMAYLGTESCVDRASYYFNQMHSLFIEHRLRKDTISISETINTLRSLFRLQELGKISANHSEQRRRSVPSFEEDIEIYLAYQYHLKDELALLVYTDLEYGRTAMLTATDLENAKNQVLDAEKKHFLQYLINHSEVWQRKIEAWNKEQWQSVNERYLDEISSPGFQFSVQTALKKEGIPLDDEDASRIMQQHMASDVLFKRRLPLTEAFLKEHNALSLLSE